MAELRRANLSEQLAEELRELIFEEFKPGRLLPSEKSIAESYNVSKPVVREALRKLEGSGMIRVEMGRGAIVQDLGSQPLTRFFEWSLRTDPEANLAHLMGLRRVVEIGAAELAARHGTADDVETLSAIAARMAESIGDAAAYAEGDTDFHLALARASKNPSLVFIVESFRDVLALVTKMGLRDPATPWEESLRTHQGIVSAIRGRDPAAARHAMEQHFVVSFGVLGLPTEDVAD